MPGAPVLMHNIGNIVQHHCAPLTMLAQRRRQTGSLNWPQPDAVAGFVLGSQSSCKVSLNAHDLCVVMNCAIRGKYTATTQQQFHLVLPFPVNKSRLQSTRDRLVFCQRPYQRLLDLDDVCGIVTGVSKLLAKRNNTFTRGHQSNTPQKQ